MKTLYKKALEAYVEMLTIHIDTKISDYDFHKETEEFYNVLFEAAHLIGEKHVDLGGSLGDDTLKEKKQKAHDIIAALREAIQKENEKKDTTLGTQDLLGSLANKLENIEGTSKSFL